jgi:hypothetical protein
MALWALCLFRLTVEEFVALAVQFACGDGRFVVDDPNPSKVVEFQTQLRGGVHFVNFVCVRQQQQLFPWRREF